MKPRTTQELNWAVSRMRRTLETFAKLDSIDKWYVLTRIAEKDGVQDFARVAYEQGMRAGR